MSAPALLLEDSARATPRDAAHGAALFVRAARASERAAGMFFRGWLDVHGAPHFPRDAQRARVLFERSVDAYAGVNSAALVQLAELLDAAAPAGAPRDPVRAALLLRRAVDFAQDVGAMFRLARMYERGRGVLQDFRIAVALYERAAVKGLHVEAMHSLAVILDVGAEGVARDTERAAELYRRAMGQQRYVRAFCDRAYSGETGGVDVREDAAKAAQKYCRANAEPGDAEAKRGLAEIMNGAQDDDSAKDTTDAAVLYSQVAEETTSTACNLALFSCAACDLAKLHSRADDEESLDRDIPRAVQLYESAIESTRDLDAAANLSETPNKCGKGAGRDEARAMELLCGILDTFFPEGFL